MSANEICEIYGESRSSAPVLIAGTLCVVEEIGRDGELIVSSLEDGEMYRIDTDAKWRRVFN